MPKKGYTLYFPKYGVEYWNYQPERPAPIQTSAHPPVVTVHETTLFKRHTKQIKRVHWCKEEEKCKCFGTF